MLLGSLLVCHRGQIIYKEIYRVILKIKVALSSKSLNKYANYAPFVILVLHKAIISFTQKIGKNFIKSYCMELESQETLTKIVRILPLGSLFTPGLGSSCFTWTNTRRIFVNLIWNHRNECSEHYYWIISYEPLPCLFKLC